MTEETEVRVSHRHLISLDLTSEELNLLREAIGNFQYRLTDHHSGGTSENPRAKTLGWLLECLK